MVKASAFLALEASLALRLSSTLQTLTFKVYNKVQRAMDAKDWALAMKLMNGLDLSPVFKLNEAYITYVSHLAMLFGASRLSTSTSAVSLGFSKGEVYQVVQSFRLAIQYNLQEQLIAAGVKLISLTRDRNTRPEDFSINSGASGTYLGKVMKASRPSALYPFATFMDKTGKALFDIASSLHTSRLSAFGYTAEARYLGITEYQINEQLDGRTCKVCAVMHGKVFRVSDARELLDKVIRTQDPDELKSLQPWPKQDKDTLSKLVSMSSEELVANGWHVPPFHPRCRGLLTKSGRAPHLTADKAVSPNQEEYVSSKEDFLQFGIKLSPSQINLWNKLIKTAPSEVLSNLTGVPLSELLAKAQETQKLGLQTLKVTQSGVNLELQSYAFNSKALVTQDYYFKKDLALYVGLIDVPYEDVEVLPKVLLGLYNTAKGTSMRVIQLVAAGGIDGYAWAKYGFSPTSDQWEKLKKSMASSPSKMSVLENASPLERKAFQLLMESSDPKSVFTLSDLPNLGEVMLEGTEWLGSLDLSDPESVTRFLAIMGGNA